MKFSKIKINQNVTEKSGIQEIDINRLSNVVALIGKNGCGKTRILNLLEQNLFKNISVQRLLDGSITGLSQPIKNIVNSLLPFKDYFLVNEKVNQLKVKVDNNPDDLDLLKEYQTLLTNPSINLHPSNAQQVTQLVGSLVLLLPELKQKFLRRIEYSDIQKLQEALADNTKDNTITFENLIENVSEVPYDEFKSIQKSGLKYLSKLPNQLTADYLDCLGDSEKYERRVAHKRFLSLKKLIKDFLNKDLSWDKRPIKNVVTETGVQSSSSGIWKLDNREFNYNEFSDGEKALFSYALLFFLLDANPNLNIKKSIILIDEPELHLHPDSEIDLINAMKNTVGEEGQLIFATHSISILSSLNFDEIFMVKNGNIKHPSQATIVESLSELISLEERVNKLSDFLSSIATWAFVNFMAECFSSPEVIESSKPNDPQIESFKNAVKNNSTKSSNLLLDFGAGKGRVYEQLKMDYSFIQNISYSALEPDKEFHKILKEQGAKEVYSEHSKLPKKTFDFVLLCNVLHEIPIIEWVHTINRIISSLTDEGFLVIIEAKVLTKGERIGKEGFILLDLEEIKELFFLKDLPSSINVVGKEDVITCAVLTKKQLKQISLTNVQKTLKLLEENTFTKIIELRENNDETKKNTIGFGRKNAFLSQLHINSKIAQKTLVNNTNA